MWEKNFKQLIEYAAAIGLAELDIYGQGPDEAEIKHFALIKKVNMHLLGFIAHPEALFDYKIFINCSVSEGYCTTTLEALAMHKFVIIPRHISNEPFYSFKNCLVYSTFDEFKHHIAYALANYPVNDPSIDDLTWESATTQLLSLVNRETIDDSPP